MIKQETKDAILDAVRIEDVVGDFVQLKRRGISLLGLCPFHNEHTPSFNVSVTRGIYKCFGCGKGGDAVSFIMEHEKASYPEALRYLAQKYNIEFEETVPSPAEAIQNDNRESLFILNKWAKEQFSSFLLETDEGKNIGLAYFNERGFRHDTLVKFELGYAAESRFTLTRAALKEGFKEEFLEQSGLSIKPDSGDLYDRFRGRVIFPIHNLAGKTIGFGGRILKKDEKTAKYLNSPESEIYHKSDTLYGIFQAKKGIRELDVCYLVEGYTDVISLHQSGIENAVASSGTSLTVAQIKLISRFTKNITILYDGDPAGIKASLRGIDMILEEGMNVRVVLFPEGNDPDSYIRKVGGTAFAAYIREHQQDFIFFKTQVLLGDAGGDPIRRSEVIHDILESIAKVPDSIAAALYTRQCSNLLEMEESILLGELNKIHLKKERDKARGQQGAPAPENNDYGSLNYKDAQRLPAAPLLPEGPVFPDDIQEREVLRMLINFGNSPYNEDQTAARYIFFQTEDIELRHPLHQELYSSLKFQVERTGKINPEFFTQHENQGIQKLTVDLLSNPYILSENWTTMHGIIVKTEETLLNIAIENAINHLKMRKVITMIAENQKKMKNEQGIERIMELQSIHNILNNLKSDLAKALGTVVIR